MGFIHRVLDDWNDIFGVRNINQYTRFQSFFFGLIVSWPFAILSFSIFFLFFCFVHALCVCVCCQSSWPVLYFWLLFRRQTLNKNYGMVSKYDCIEYKFQTIIVYINILFYLFLTSYNLILFFVAIFVAYVLCVIVCIWDKKFEFIFLTFYPSFFFFSIFSRFFFYFVFIEVDNNEQFVHSTPTSFTTNAHMSNNNGAGSNGNNLNINLPDNNAILRLEVELRDKNVRRRPHQRQAKGYHLDRIRAVTGMTASAATVDGKYHAVTNANNYFVPMEKVSDFLVCNVLLCAFCLLFFFFR